MIIQHNIMALNSYRNLGINNTNLSQNLEKLSSGYRINRAADDAAGLAISEKMRAQITGLERAVMNAQDGASLIQTAEGGLQEVHSMLNRMIELATQAANGTIQASDRQKIEAEVQALKDEIDRISKATNFNGIKLLDGSLADSAPRNIEVSGVKIDEYSATPGIYSFGPVGGTQTAYAADAPGAPGPTDFSDLKAGDTLSYTIGLNNGESVTVNFTVSDNGQYAVSDDGTVYELSTDPDADPQGYWWEDEDIANALESEFRKTSLQNDFIITKNDSGGIQLKNRIAGTEPPQVTGLSYTKNNEAAVQITQDTIVPDHLGDDNTVAYDEIRALGSSSFTHFQVLSPTSTNEVQAVFTVNGQQFVLVDRQDITAAAGGDEEYARILADLENRGINVIDIDTPADGTLSKEDMVRISAHINQKTGLALHYDETYGGGSIVLDAPQRGNGLTMQVGDTADDYQKITVSVDDLSSAGLGIQNISVASQEAASNALDKVNAAIEKVSVNRGNLGALQNRLEYTINNLNVSVENMTAAESRVRDVDMAKEMMEFTKNNVLAQAAQAMLAQANMQPQNVLQLLR